MRRIITAIALAGVVALLAMPTFLQAQMDKHTGSYSKEYRRADSLLNQGMPESANKIIKDILQKATAKSQQVEILKANLYLMNTTAYEEDNLQNNLRFAEQRLKESTFPNDAIWHSILATTYQQYYQNNQWQILQRTTLADDAQTTFEFWDARRFYKEIATHFDASLKRSDELKNIALEQYDPIIIKGVNTRKLRPTLYDLLVFRAIDFYKDEGKELVNPAHTFTLSNADFLSDAQKFINLRITSPDSLSLQWKALLLYQQVMKRHLNDASPDPLIDADLARLEYVYSHAVLSDRKELYRDALLNITQKYPSNPLISVALYRLATLDIHQETKTNLYRSYRENSSEKTKRGLNLIAVKAQLEAIIKRFPKSEGAVAAENFIASISTKSINLNCEKAVLPGEASKVLVQYRNYANISLRLVKLTHKQLMDLSHTYDERKKYTLLSKTTSVAQWSQSLPGSADMEPHSTEVMIKPLPVGAYALVASEKDDAIAKNGALVYTSFQVTEISLLRSNDFLLKNELTALHRKSGKPMANVAIQLITNVRNREGGQNEYAKTATAISGNEGKIQVSGLMLPNVSAQAVLATKGKDTFYTDAYLYNYDGTPHKETRSQQTFFFTDRSIYRPGQTIFFKGIIIDRDPTGKDHKVVSGKTTTVIFRDANGQEVKKLTITTNEYGSFNGTFIAPEGVLTGMMGISNETGNTSISVEEYKRPKFFVQYDTLKGSYALNENILIKGAAKAYAGQNIDNATVKYRVVRNTRWPYYWSFYRWGMPQSPEQEIANGSAKTDANGNFELSFKALPDEQVDPKTLPLFTYTLYADVTDINGETRSATQTVNVGYRTLQIEHTIADNANRTTAAAMRITTRNMNGVFVPASLTVKVYQLKSPGLVLRKRLWETPDQYVMDSATFKKHFPIDEYREESNPMNWGRDKLVWEKTWTTTEDGQVAIDQKVWNQNGHYLVVMQTKDAKGQEVSDQKVVQLWDEKNEGVLHVAAYSLTDKESYEPGNTAKAYLVTGLENTYWLMYAINAQRESWRESIDLNKPTYTYSKALTENERGGIALSWITVKENRVYETSERIAVPWSNKDLNIAWETHRDKLQPGERETWTMIIKGDKKDKVAAEMVATLYDASLDAFKPHAFSPMYGLYPYAYAQPIWAKDLGFGLVGSNALGNEGDGYMANHYDKVYDYLYAPTYHGYRTRYSKAVSIGGTRSEGNRYVVNGVMSAPTASEQDAQASVQSAKTFAPPPPNAPQADTSGSSADKYSKDFSVRKNLKETAFFMPALQTDAEGNVRLSFQMPEALTEWKLIGFAHTKDLKTGNISGSIKTQKDLMVMPNMPRFLRQGDDIVLSSKISNLSKDNLTGEAFITIVDAITQKNITSQFAILEAPHSIPKPGPMNEFKTPFSVSAIQNTEVSWQLRVPQALYHPVVITIKAQAGNFTDGEENTLPVVTNRMLVTETLPLPMRGTGTKTFRFDKLLSSPAYGTSGASLVHHALTLEYTPNPAWYVVQALPYMMEYPYECAEQTFNRYYANAIGSFIVQKTPKIEKVFREWEQDLQNDPNKTVALLSNLEKNQELKSALLEETPWVLEAKNESEQKKRIAYLFEATKMKRELSKSLDKLEQMLLPEGAFPWFKGMYASEYITQYITTGIGRLQHLGISDAGRINTIAQRTIPYLDKQVQRRYEELVRGKVNLSEQHISYYDVQYLYMRSFFKNIPVSAGAQKAVDYYYTQAAKYWPKFNPYMKGMIALALHRKGDAATPKNIIASLNETSINKEEMGKYWKEMGSSWWWYEAPIEAQALLIECYDEVAKDDASVDALRVWLLKQKQTQNWKTTKATADACYAFLLQGTQWLEVMPEVSIALGDKVIRNTEIKAQAGTGYFKQRYEAAAVSPTMGNISVSVKSNAPASQKGTSWGAVYWQYFENLDKITSAQTNLVVRKKLFVERNGDRGPLLYEVKEGETLKVGDKVKVRIEIETDRDMEYVHLKDMRGACFEPVNVLSGYRWGAGFGYYESTKDVSSNFFIDYLRRGKYVFEYPVFVNSKGDFSNGITTLQCMYAPEFSAHSEGLRVKVK